MRRRKKPRATKRPAQNDVFGAVLDSILLHVRRSDRLPRRLWPIVQAQAQCATAMWREPARERDAGFVRLGCHEYRGDDAAYSRLLDTAGDVLREEIGSIRRLVDDFSAFAKLPKVEPKPVDLGALVDDFARAHPEWNGQVRVERPPAAVGALCDRMLLRRVLANLVENSIQSATGAGRSPLVVVSAGLGDGPDTAVLRVDDNGPGVPPATGARVFDPYFTTKENGTGLGLAIVRKIVIDHGGDVTVGRAPPPLGGARFTVVLPVGGRSESGVPPA